MNPAASRFAVLMGSASLMTLSGALSAGAQEMTAQAAPETVPEQVLVTGSLIHGTAAVGVPVTNLGTQDFAQTGAVTIGDLFRYDHVGACSDLRVRPLASASGF